MPRKIRRCPGSQDPRNWDWLPYGFGEPGVPPWNWKLQTAIGDPEFWFFNRGIVLPHFFPTPPPFTTAQFVLEGGDVGQGPLVELIVTGYRDALPYPGMPNGFTVVIEVRIQYLIFISWAGISYFYRPDPYQDFSIDVLGVFGGAGDFPNPLVLSPVKSNFPEGPIP